MRRKFSVFYSLILLFVGNALAEDAPFAWPEAYSYTTQLTSKTDPDYFFTNTYHRDGKKSRNDSPTLGVMIFRLDQHKRITIKPNGSVQVAKLPANWPMNSIFPPNRPWEKFGRGWIGGQEAIKYKITRDPVEAERFKRAPFVVFWLSIDKSMPLRMEDGDTVLDFSNYSVGPQEEKLFEPPVK